MVRRNASMSVNAALHECKTLEKVGEIYSHILLRTILTTWTQKNGKSRTLDACINKGASTIYYWLELIVMCNLPFSFVENQYIRKGMKYSDISVDTLMKYIRKLTAAVEEEKSNHLPEKFGLIVDGWSEGSTKKRKISAESKYIDLT